MAIQKPDGPVFRCWMLSDTVGIRKLNIQIPDKLGSDYQLAMAGILFLAIWKSNQLIFLSLA